MKAIKTLVRNWLPPAIVSWIRQHRLREEGISFEGDFATWEEASARCTGYNAEEILAKVLDATHKVKHGQAVFERDSVLFDHVEYSWPVLSGLLWAAARNGGKLNVLDFGGALGSSYFQNQRFLHALPEVRWNVVEQSHYVESGQAKIQDEQLRFYYTIEECLNETQPNVILLSSVLQYLKSPSDVVTKLASTGAECLIVDRTPFSTDDKDKVLIQRVPPSIYKASYPMWVFSQSEFIRLFDVDWNLIVLNTSPEGHIKTESGFDFLFQGMLMESRR